MNVKQIKSFTRGYLYDRPLLTIEFETVYNDVKSILDDIYENDFEYYDKFYKLPTSIQINILENFLDYKYKYKNEECINEVVGAITGSIALAAVLYIISVVYAGSRLTRKVYKFIHDIGSLFKKIGNFMSRLGDRWKFKYEMINETAKECLQKAGIKDINKLGVPVYELLRNKNIHLMATKIQIEQAEKLRTCYTKTFIQKIVLLTDAYFGCLKSSERLELFKKTAARDIVLALYTVPKTLRGSCNEIYKHLIELLKSFKEYTEYVYNNTEEIEEVYKYLRIEIEKTLNKYK